MSQSLRKTRPSDRRHQLLVTWERRCRDRGQANYCRGADARFLVTALLNGLHRASVTTELGRAARTWGARFAAPVDAVAVLFQLREAMSDLADELFEGRLDGAPAPPALNDVFDQILMEAVDAASANLRSAARQDPLTGCANRRALDEELGHALASARRSGLDLSVVVIDLDGLKAINDARGHAAGDAALVSLVSVLRRALREADVLYRVGGDEFVVVAAFTDPAGARALMRRAERLGGPAFSWGVASMDDLGQLKKDHDDDAAALLGVADADLYERRRRNRRAAVRAGRRRRATAVASVAASAAALAASGVGIAAAVASGGRSEPVASPVLPSPDTGAPVPLRGPFLRVSMGGSAGPSSAAVGGASHGTVPTGSSPIGSTPGGVDSTLSRVSSALDLAVSGGTALSEGATAAVSSSSAVSQVGQIVTSAAQELSPDRSGRSRVSTELGPAQPGSTPPVDAGAGADAAQLGPAEPGATPPVDAGAGADAAPLGPAEPAAGATPPHAGTDSAPLSPAGPGASEPGHRQPGTGATDAGGRGRATPGP